MSAAQKKAKPASSPDLADLESETSAAVSDDAVARDVASVAVQESLPMPAEASSDDSRVEDASGQGEDLVSGEPAVVEHEDGAEMVGDPFYLLTNRGNLLYWASSGLIGPLEQFEGEKYYDDLLRFTPGHLTVFRGALGYAVDLVADMDIEQYPIAVEVDSSLVQPVSLVHGEAEGAGQAMGITASSIPFAAAKRFIFRNDHELSEVSLREYEATHPLSPMVVEPTCFEGDGLLKTSEVRSLLERASIGRTAVATSSALQTADRCAGAVCMVLAVLPTEQRFAGEFDWVPPATTSVGGLAAGLRTLLGSATAGSAAALNDCLDVFSGLRRAKGWNPIDVHSELADRLLKAKPARAKALKAQLDYMRRVLDLEATLDLADPVMKDDALSAALVFLLHPDTGEIQEWLREEPAPDVVALLAAAYSGLVAGMARVLADFKPEILMYMLVSYYGGSLHILSGEAAFCGSVSAEFVPTQDVGGELVLSADSTPFMRREKQSTTAILLDSDLGNPAHAAGLLMLCDEMGWDDCRWRELTLRSSDEIECSGIDSLSAFFSALGMRIRAISGGLTVRFKGDLETRESLDDAVLRSHLESDGLTKAVGATYREVAEDIRAKR